MSNHVIRQCFARLSRPGGSRPVLVASLVAGLSLGVPTVLYAQTGTVTGRVIDASNNQPLAGVQLRRRNVALRRIDADHLRAESRQRLAQQAGAATDIEDAQAFEAGQAARVAVELAAGGVANEREPQRIDLVQRRHLAARIPPLDRVHHPVEQAIDDMRADRRPGFRLARHVGHAMAPSAAR